MITFDELTEVLEFDPLVNSFRWKVSLNIKIKIGDIAGCLIPNGYRGIRFNGKDYKEHRLVWLYHHSVWPKRLDHINRVKDDNRIENLREVTHQQNMFNTSAYKNNKLGVKNICVSKSFRYQVGFTLNGKVVYLGTFDTIEEAIEKRDIWSKENHGEFATLSK